MYNISDILKNEYLRLSRAAGDDSYQGQDVKDYVLRGPNHTEEVGQINIPDGSHHYISDLGDAHSCYKQAREDGWGHYEAWHDICRCDKLPAETKVQLRRVIEKENPNFFVEASISEYTERLFGKAYIERHKPFSKRRKRNVRRFTRTMPGGFAAKRDALISFGIESEIVDHVIAENQKKNSYQIVVDPQDSSITHALKGIETSGIKTAGLILQGNGKFQIEVHAHKPLKESKVCIIGLPDKRRKAICERLASFYNVPHLTMEDVLKEAKTMGLIEEHKMGQEKALELAYQNIHDNTPGYILEGYPLTKDQARTCRADAVVFVNHDMDSIINYQKDKRWCPACMMSYHLKESKLSNPASCERCGTKLTIRPEDLPSKVKNDYYTWRTSLSPAMEYLKNSKSFIRIPTSMDSEEAASMIERYFKKKDVHYRR